MRSEIVHKAQADSPIHVPSAAGTDQGHGPLALLTLFAAGLFCYLLF